MHRGDITEILLATNHRARCSLSRHGDELWLDLADTRLDIPPRPLFGFESPPLRVLRAIDQADSGARVVIEVTEPTDYAIAALPYELIIRLAPAGRAPDIAAPLMIPSPAPKMASNDRKRSSERQPKALPAPAKDTPSQEFAAKDHDQLLTLQPPSTARASLQLPDDRAFSRGRVVVDAGHGGYDPGTRSADGLLEKDIALQIAQRLAQRLQRQGLEVELTRDSDTFVSLSQRTNAANRADADLFVSIHLNSSPNPATSGLEVYYLNNTTDRATIRLARMENGDAASYGDSTEPNLNYILSDLRQQYKATQSSSLARMIDASFEAEMRNYFGQSARSLGAKKGPFYVLVGAHMPAVLVECGFLSNREEGHRLASPDYQDHLATGIASAVIDYLNSTTAVGNL
ncbi:MAG TPA: N-acetylmuramoyl-L-alanine amidase [Candidatus Binataceae bacterium]